MFQFYEQNVTKKSLERFCNFGKVDEITLLTISLIKRGNNLAGFSGKIYFKSKNAKMLSRISMFNIILI